MFNRSIRTDSIRDRARAGVKFFIVLPDAKPICPDNTPVYWRSIPVPAKQ